jgi:serine/threonine protein phosphatase PrpC
MELTVGTSSIPGPARNINQDCIGMQSLAGGCLLVTIADGLGGYEASAEASALASKWVSAHLKEAGERAALTQRTLKSAFQGANLALWQQAMDSSTALKTTLSALICTPTEALIGHVGDCRVFLVRAGSVSQLTTDHSLSQQMGLLRWAWLSNQAHSGSRHRLHRVLGDHPMVRVDTTRVATQPGDRFLLCSDGVWGSMSSADFTALVTKAESDQALAELLTGEALARGGTDDASAAFVSIGGTKT